MMNITLNKVYILAFFISLIMPFSAFAKNSISSDDIIKIVDDKKLYTSREWKNLLHYDNNKSVIDKKSSFFLSNKGYKKPKYEMYETVKAFLNKDNKGDEHAICKYPARFEFILKNTELKRSDFPKVSCKAYDEFKQKAPIDTLSLVFAAENNSVPVSIMGHLFIKISGQSGGRVREHAFSYFATDVDQLSPKFYFDVLFSSIDGMYVLSPYVLKRDDYLFFEQRPIWEVDLKLTAEQKSYIHKHMWELKENNVRYSFIFHNCGTAAINLLKIVYGDLGLYKIFETPIDYIRQMEKDDNIDDVSLIPSPEYNLKMIRANYSLYDIYKAKNKSEDLDDKQKYLANLLHNYDESMGLITNDIYLNIDESKLGLVRKTNNLLDTKKSSRVYVGYNYFKKNAIELEFMPLYQDYFDVSKAYIDDYETKIGSVNVVYDDKLYINRFDAISMRSIIDSSMSWKMPSKQFRVSFENSLGERGTNLRPVFEGGVGYAYDIFNQKVKPYILPKVGYRHDNIDNFYFVPEYGVILKPTENSKIVLTYEKYYDTNSNNRGFDERLSANFAHLLTKDTTIYIKYNKYSGTYDKEDKEFNLGLGVNF